METFDHIMLELQGFPRSVEYLNVLAKYSKEYLPSPLDHERFLDVSFRIPCLFVVAYSDTQIYNLSISTYLNCVKLTF